MPFRPVTAAHAQGLSVYRGSMTIEQMLALAAQRIGGHRAWRHRARAAASLTEPTGAGRDPSETVEFAERIKKGATARHLAHRPPSSPLIAAAAAPSRLAPLCGGCRRAQRGAVEGIWAAGTAAGAAAAAAAAAAARSRTRLPAPTARRCLAARVSAQTEVDAVINPENWVLSVPPSGCSACGVFPLVGTYYVTRSWVRGGCAPTPPPPRSCC